jgi:hypothetical protein
MILLLAAFQQARFHIKEVPYVQGRNIGCFLALGAVALASSSSLLNYKTSTWEWLLL